MHAPSSKNKGRNSRPFFYLPVGGQTLFIQVFAQVSR